MVSLTPWEPAIEAVREPALALGESQIYFRKFFDFDGVKEYEEAIIDLGVAFGFTGTEALEAGCKNGSTWRFVWIRRINRSGNGSRNCIRYDWWYGNGRGSNKTHL